MVLIGKPISEIWLLASQSLESVITTTGNPVEIKHITSRAAGRFREKPRHAVRLCDHRRRIPYQTDASADFVRKFIHRLAGERSEEIIPIAGVTIKNVAKGILGLRSFSLLQPVRCSCWLMYLLQDFGLCRPGSGRSSMPSALSSSRHHLPFLGKRAAAGYPVDDPAAGHRLLRQCTETAADGKGFQRANAGHLPRRHRWIHLLRFIGLFTGAIVLSVVTI